MDDFFVMVDEFLMGERRIVFEKYKRKGGFKLDW